MLFRSEGIFRCAGSVLFEWEAKMLGNVWIPCANDNDDDDDDNGNDDSTERRLIAIYFVVYVRWANVNQWHYSKADC